MPTSGTGNYDSELDLKHWQWPFLRVNSNGAKEYECPHGVGHGGVHGCDGCCGHKSYTEAGAKRELKKQRRKENGNV